MKKIKLLVVALVAMLGFAACDNKTEHIYDDHSADLVGTWSCLTENYAEVLIINVDGSAVSYGVEDGEYWENVRGTVVVKEGNITMTFEDNDNFTGHFDIIPGKSFSLYEDSGERYIYQYCANDLSDEIVGMWVCNDGVENDIAINTFAENGKSYITTFLADENDYVLNKEGDYKVIGNLLIKTVKGDSNTSDSYIVIGLDYMPNGTELGDIMTMYLPAYEAKTSFLRIKQSLDLPGNKYDYRATYISNVKGEDKDIPFMNTSFNFAKMDGSIIDKFLKATLFAVEFPDANTLKYNFLLGGEISPMRAPIEVEDNKMTIKMSVTNPAYQDVVVYAFQDQDNTQMHLYMPTSSFEKFFANASVHMMLSNGQLNENDTEAIANEFKKIADAIESINLSLVMTKATKAL